MKQQQISVSEKTEISMPIKNMAGIIFLALSSAWFGFSVIERLNIIETELQLMQQDLLEASTQKPIDQEQFMLLEFLSSNQEKLKEKVEEEIPNIKKNDMTLQFHEERIIDLEARDQTLKLYLQF
jgi:hypothetical protein